MEDPRVQGDAFDREYKVMSIFIENAKTYVQLSVGALLLTVTFLHDILGIPKDQKIPADFWLILSWWGFLLAIVSGALYQYYAAKFLEWKSELPSLVNSSEARIVAQKAHCWRRKGTRSVVDLYIGVRCRCFDLANRFSR